MTMRHLGLSILLGLSLPAFATTPPPERSMPVTYTWIATGCRDWNCAAAALAVASGDATVFTVPTSDPDFPWVVLRRVETGSVWVPDDEPFAVDSFTTLGAAVGCISAIDKSRAPLMMTTFDGAKLVVALKPNGAPRRRSAGR
jgi:hypothetical protein